MSKDILFDNIIITDEYVVAERWAADTFEKKRQKIAKESVSVGEFVGFQKKILCTSELKHRYRLGVE